MDVAARRGIDRAAFHALMAEAAESGDYDLPRREGSDHITPVDGVMATVMTRLDSTERRDGEIVNTTDPDFLTRAEIAGRRQALEYVRFLVDRVPGYERAALLALSTQIGVRETRRVYGDARLTREDVLAARQFDDQVGLCGAPIEDHHGGTDTAWTYLPDGQAVGIPYASLVVRDATNVLVAGRCFSATHDAHASVRSMAQCMAMGQAAGTAAAMAAAAGVDSARAGPRRTARPAARRTARSWSSPHERRAHRPRRHPRRRAGDHLRPRAPRDRWRARGGARARVPAQRRRRASPRSCRGAAAHGLRSAVDAMPADAGRNASLLAELSRRSGVQIVAPTGLHHDRYYGPSHWSARIGEDELADLFVADIEEGIDAHDYSGPVVARTEHRAGIIKVAGSEGGPSERDARIFRAAATAHLAHGRPDPDPLRARHGGTRAGPPAGRCTACPPSG